MILFRVNRKLDINESELKKKVILNLCRTCMKRVLTFLFSVYSNNLPLLKHFYDLCYKYMLMKNCILKGKGGQKQWHLKLHFAIFIQLFAYQDFHGILVGLPKIDPWKSGLPKKNSQWKRWSGSCANYGSGNSAYFPKEVPAWGRDSDV